MDTSNDDQVREQEELAKRQSAENVELQEKQDKETDAERKRLSEEADQAHTEKDVAQKAALEKENQEREADAKLNR